MPADAQDTLIMPRCNPDPHGQAALLLMESLLHGLLERKALTIREALAITATAAEVAQEMIDASSEATATGRRSLQLIKRIADSLAIDHPDGPLSPEP